MKPNEWRLQTAEHILAKLLQNDYGVSVGVCKFRGKEGSLEVISEKDMRDISLPEYQGRVQEIVNQNLEIRKYEIKREEAGDIHNLHKVPASLERIRVVEIGDFDKRACGDPHVDNTAEIGKFMITKLKRVGKNRYRFVFRVEK
jgi:Ser-tRNA(Ala) deacylase AlaX